MYTAKRFMRQLASLTCCPQRKGLRITDPSHAIRLAALKVPPKQSQHEELGRMHLSTSLDMGRPLVRLADLLDWQRIGAVFGKRFAAGTGELMVGRAREPRIGQVAEHKCRRMSEQDAGRAGMARAVTALAQLHVTGSFVIVFTKRALPTVSMLGDAANSGNCNSG